MLKSLHSTGLAAALLALTACHTSPPRAEEDPAQQAFKAGMLQALHRSIRQADTGEQIGAVSLKVTLDHRSAPIDCKATRAPGKYQNQMPNDIPRSDFPALARLVETQCRKAIYPIVPPELQTNAGGLEVVAPMMLVLSAQAQAPGTSRMQANAQRDYFWQHMLRDQAVSSIGRAAVYWQANAQGQVAGCLVQLHPHPLRPADFRLDGELQARLSSRCRALNLEHLPGFMPDLQGVAEGYSELEYAPWRVGEP